MWNDFKTIQHVPNTFAAYSMLGKSQYYIVHINAVQKDKNVQKN